MAGRWSSMQSKRQKLIDSFEKLEKQNEDYYKKWRADDRLLMRKPEDSQIPAYSQGYIDTLKAEIDYWRKQCHELQVKLRDATYRYRRPHDE
jgi:hypothetical protein